MQRPAGHCQHSRLPGVGKSVRHCQHNSKMLGQHVWRYHLLLGALLMLRQRQQMASLAVMTAAVLQTAPMGTLRHSRA
jgi:hypothetical protein